MKAKSRASQLELITLMEEPTLDTIREAAERIKPLVHRTPVFTSESINDISDAEIFFKCDNFQKSGSFKMRGAANAILSLSKKEIERGVATHSSGNHAQAVARAAYSVGANAYIVMPQTAPEVKRKAVLSYGARITMCKPTLKSREKTLEQVVEETGAAFVHPYNDYRVIAGQGTAALELLEETKKLDIILAPVGGGGMVSGTAIVAHALSAETDVIACEPEGADDAYRSFKEGEIIPAVSSHTIADGLLTSLGDKTFAIIRRHVKEILTVSDEEIIEAMRLIWERMKIIIEPSSAVPLAALLKHKEKFEGKRVGILITGGNVDLGKLPF